MIDLTPGGPIGALRGACGQFFLKTMNLANVKYGYLRAGRPPFPSSQAVRKVAKSALWGDHRRPIASKIRRGPGTRGPISMNFTETHLYRYRKK